MTDRQAFDVCGPLPRGIALLEASAGTGKTFTIASLAARYVAEGTPLHRLLIITFTRMATGELRERVRDRLVSAADGLSRVLAGVPVDNDDDVLQLLAEGSPDLVALRHDRVAKAIANFDAATIDTTHGFCLRVLSELGVAGDPQRDITLVEDVRDLLEEVVDDLYIRRFWREPAPFDRAEAIRIGQAILDHPCAEVVPERRDLTVKTPAAMRRRLIDAVQDEMDRRKRAANILTYDDVLINLDRTLSDRARGPSACQRLRANYDVALVDEFQDTDPVQWNIMRAAFGEGGSTLVLIGDPKQAIYAFRGADVYAYLSAAETARSVATLATNWRSDQGLIDAYDALFAGTSLGHAGITYRHVSASPANVEPRLVDAPDGTPLRIRVVDRGAVRRTPQGYVSAPGAKALIAGDLAAEVVGLLSSPAEVVTRRRDGSESGRDRVRPGHLAVLVRTNKHAAIVREALHEAGIPAVIGGAGSVFATQPAVEWLRLLDALEQPTARDRAAAAALTAFMGWSADEVARASDATWEDLHWRLHRWSAVLRRRGVAALVEHVTTSQALPARVLARPSGERFLTDLHHIGQLLHAAASQDGLGSAALTAWLRRRIAEAGDDDADDEDRSRRLESDAEAVQVLTIHRSKGLEFPVVYCPYLWDGYSPEPKVPVFHDPDNSNRRTIDVSGEGEDWQRHCDAHRAEERGEDLRLLYVALTRARNQAVLWWASTFDSKHSSLGRLLFSRDAGGNVRPIPTGTPTDQKIVDTLADLVARSDGAVSVEVVTEARRGEWADVTPAAGDLDVAAFERHLDELWRRTSYTGITSGSHERGPVVSSEPEDAVIADEPALAPGVGGAGVGGAGAGAAGAAVRAEAGGLDAGGLEVVGPDDSDLEHLRDVPLLLADMPGGADVGTVIHRVLEETDFSSPDLTAALQANLDLALAGDPALLGLDRAPQRRDMVVDGLRAAIQTPLGPLAGEARLADIGRPDRLDEMGFELPLVGGDAPDGELKVTDMADALRRWLPAGDPVASYATRLSSAPFDVGLRGYLNGFLDLVVRLPGGKYAVIDYKTNWLGVGDEPLTAWHYRPAAVWAEMQHAHYPLQALLYSIALHRYLRWRVKGYDPATHLAGVLYLFVRGMSSPQFPRAGEDPCGVWSWRPPAPLVVGLSELFDRGRAAA